MSSEFATTTFFNNVFRVSLAIWIDNFGVSHLYVTIHYYAKGLIIDVVYYFVACIYCILLRYK